jgi:hypothetical protein
MMTDFFQEVSIVSLLELPSGKYDVSSTMKERDFEFLNEILNCYTTETIQKGIICISATEMKDLVGKHYSSTQVEKILQKFSKHKVIVKNNAIEGAFSIMKNVTLNKDNTHYFLELSKEMYRLLLMYLKKQENLSEELTLHLEAAIEKVHTQSERTSLPRIEIRSNDNENEDKIEEAPENIYHVIRERFSKKKIEDSHKLMTEFFQEDWIVSLLEAPSGNYRVSSTMDIKDLNFLSEVLDHSTTDTIKNGFISISYHEMEHLVDKYYVVIEYEKMFITTVTLELFIQHKVFIKSDKIEGSFPILKKVTLNKDTMHYSLELSNQMHRLLSIYVAKKEKKITFLKS